MSYLYNPLFQLDPSLNGLTLVQINPHMAVDLRQESENVNWLYEKVENNWQKVRQLSTLEAAEAWDQSSDFAVLDASKLKGGWDLPVEEAFQEHYKEENKFKSFMKKLIK